MEHFNLILLYIAGVGVIGAVGVALTLFLEDRGADGDLETGKEERQRSRRPDAK